MFAIVNNSFSVLKFIPFLAISYIFYNNSELLLKASLFTTLYLAMKWMYPELQNSLPFKVGGFGISGN